MSPRILSFGLLSSSPVQSSARLARTASGLVVLAICALPVTGCEKSADRPGAQTPANLTSASLGPAPNDIPLASKTGPGVESGGLNVSSEIARLCGLQPMQEASTVAPKFDFDSAAIGDDDKALLAAVAKCLTEGALRGRSVKLTGRADPRGEDEYNMTLGEHRADAVKRYMHDLGVQSERMTATSRGELDATGKDEDGWAKDRRVDIDLL
jgi:peptidoglycan-associated lipoprotein